MDSSGSPDCIERPPRLPTDRIVATLPAVRMAIIVIVMNERLGWSQTVAQQATRDHSTHGSTCGRLANGANYLDVKWRLAWMRSEHPDAQIETEMLRDEEDGALFKADVRLPEGGAASRMPSCRANAPPDTSSRRNRRRSVGRWPRSATGRNTLPTTCWPRTEVSRRRRAAASDAAASIP